MASRAHWLGVARTARRAPFRRSNARQPGLNPRRWMTGKKGLPRSAPQKELGHPGRGKGKKNSNSKEFDYGLPETGAPWESGSKVSRVGEMAPKSRPGALGGKGAKAPVGNGKADGGRAAGVGKGAGAGAANTGEYNTMQRGVSSFDAKLGGSRMRSGGAGPRAGAGAGAGSGGGAGAGGSGGGGGGPGKLFAAIAFSGSITLGAVMAAQGVSDEESRVKIEAQLPLMKPVFDRLTPLYLQLCEYFPSLKDDKKGGGIGGGISSGGSDSVGVGKGSNTAPQETGEEGVAAGETVDGEEAKAAGGDVEPAVDVDSVEEVAPATHAAVSKYGGKYSTMDAAGHAHHPETLRLQQEFEETAAAAADSKAVLVKVAANIAAAAAAAGGGGAVAAVEDGSAAAPAHEAHVEQPAKDKEQNKVEGTVILEDAAQIAADTAAAAKDAETVLQTIAEEIATAAEDANVAAAAAAAVAVAATAAEAAEAAAKDSENVLKKVKDGIAAATAKASEVDAAAAASAAAESPAATVEAPPAAPTPTPTPTPTPAPAVEAPPVEKAAPAAVAAVAEETVAAVTTIVKEFVPVEGTLHGTVDDLQVKVQEMEMQLASQLASDAVKLQTTLEAAYAQRVQTLSEETEDAIAIAEAAMQRRAEAEEELQRFKDAFESEVEKNKSDATQGVQEQLAKDRDALMKEMHEHLVSQELRHRATIKGAIQEGEKRIQEECEANMLIDVGEERARRIVRMEEMFVRVKAVEGVLSEHVQSNTSYRDSHVVLMATEMLQQAVASKAPIQQQVETLRASTDDPLVRSAMDTIPASALEHGVVSQQELTRRFATLKEEVIPLTLMSEDSGPFGYFVSSFFSSLIIRDYRGPLPGSRADYVLSRAEHHLYQGDLEEAASTVNELRGHPRKAAENWLKDARATLETERAIEVAKAQATLHQLRLN